MIKYINYIVFYTYGNKRKNIEAKSAAEDIVDWRYAIRVGEALQILHIQYLHYKGRVLYEGDKDQGQADSINRKTGLEAEKKLLKTYV